MSVRRVVWAAAIVLAALLELSCGDVYRPVVIPTNTTPPNTSNYHAVFSIQQNASGNVGSALEVDVSGDSNAGEVNMGLNPTHAGILPNNSRVFVANAGSLIAGQSDVVMSFTPAPQSAAVSGLGTPIVFTYPNIGPIKPLTKYPYFCQYNPVFVTAAQNTAVYVANYGALDYTNCNLTSTDSVSQLNPSSNTITNIVNLPAGSHPVAMSETSDGLNLYVLNQGTSTVMDLSPVDLSTIKTIGLPAGSTPAWVAARGDNQRVYIVTEGDGKLYTINTTTNTVDAGISVGGPGANFAVFDPGRNRLYVTNPAAQTAYVFDATSDPPSALSTISMAAGVNSPCPGGCSPISITALPDGSRFYVASYQTATTCPDTTLGTSVACMIPMLTVFDAASFAVKPAASTLLPSSPSLSLLSSAQFAPTQYAVPVVNDCAPTGAFAPGQTRFRMFTTSASDSSHVYVSICDASTIADIITTTSSIAVGNNTPDTLVTNITPASASCSGPSCGSVATISGYAIASNVVTFAAANSFTPGGQVSIAGLTTTNGKLLNGQILTVIATGLSGTQFECILPSSFSGSSAQQTSDTGTAVPLPSPQTPLFLLTGQ